MTLDIVLSILGLGVLGYRLQPFLKEENVAAPGEEALVSIVVPCRDEEKNIAALLESFQNLQYPRYEVIVVDDASTDRTVEVARTFPFVVIEAPPKPRGWIGKNWACWQGAHLAKGDILLFTDADTRHEKLSLQKAVGYFRARQWTAMSAPPFHACEFWWEKFLGFFYLLPLLATAYRQRPEPKRLFAIGQYLMFDRGFYETLGGHQTIASELVDDMSLAELWLKNGCRYGVYPWASLYRVQMYSSWNGFFKGWIRLLRLGMKRGSWQSFIELILIFKVFLVFSSERPLWLFLLFGLGLVFLAQRKIGRFSIGGLVMVPINILLFTVLSGLATQESLLKKTISWRHREYPAEKN